MFLHAEESYFAMYGLQTIRCKHEQAFGAGNKKLLGGFVCCQPTNVRPKKNQEEGCGIASSAIGRTMYGFDQNAMG